MSGKESILISQIVISNYDRNLRFQNGTSGSEHGDRRYLAHINSPEFDGFRNQTKRLDRIAVQQMRILVGVKLI
jgi:hypothetical protein